MQQEIFDALAYIFLRRQFVRPHLVHFHNSLLHNIHIALHLRKAEKAKHDVISPGSWQEPHF